MRKWERNGVFLNGVCAAVCSKLYGQFYLLIGWYLLQTKYMASGLITEVQYNLSSATGNARAFIVGAQVSLTTTECILLARVIVYIRVYYQVVCSEFVYGRNFL